MMSGHGRGRKENDTKQMILDAAMLQFAKRGYAGARVDEIARQSNCNKRMIYVYFESKSCLYQSVLESIRDSLKPPLQLEVQSKEDFINNIRRVFQFYFDINIRHPDIMRILNWDALSSGGGKRAVDYLYVELLDHCRALYRQASELGILNKEYGERELAFMAMMTHGIFHAFFTRPAIVEEMWEKPCDDEELQKEFVDHFLHMLSHSVFELS